MGSSLPHINYRMRDPANRHFGFIEIDAVEKYWIDNLEEFYEAFGYSKEMRKQGIMPDEFIWEEYIKDTKKHTDCYRFHILEYLFQHSESFRQRHLADYEHWIAEHASTMKKSGEHCCTCKCKTGESHTAPASAKTPDLFKLKNH